MKKTAVLSFVFALLISLFSGYNNTVQAATFSDVPDNYWAKKEIDFLVNKQVIKGFQDGTFKPEMKIKRIQAASMIVRALKLSTENRPNPQLSDITPDFQEYAVVATIVDEGIMSGSNGKFNPYAETTRAQMAKILQKAFKLTGQTDRIFADVPKGHWAFDHVQAITAKGITTGYSDNTFRPNNFTSRAQFAAFMARAMDASFIPVTHFTLNNKVASFATQGMIEPLTSIKLGMTISQAQSKIGKPIGTYKDENFRIDEYAGFDIWYDVSNSAGKLVEINLFAEKVNVRTADVKKVLGAPLDEYTDETGTYYYYEFGENSLYLATDDEDASKIGYVFLSETIDGE